MAPKESNRPSALEQGSIALEEMTMDRAQIADYMRAISADLTQFDSEVSYRDAMAVLVVTRRDNAGRWARIATKGELFDLTVDGEFYLAHPTVRPDDSEIMNEIDQLLNVAVAYLEGRFTRIDKTFPVILVDTPTGQEKLRAGTWDLSIGLLVRKLFKRA
ncbi:hypothetical protein ACNHYB_11480 [Isoptericola jiangsuensis]|uniref:hypothetical protein n=1 Tax=Isoptericola jiangsuensis TaxID=548579 RepID=UPI003AAD232F